LWKNKKKKEKKIGFIVVEKKRVREILKPMKMMVRNPT
jgi:hypothetical protein